MAHTAQEVDHTAQEVDCIAQEVALLPRKWLQIITPGSSYYREICESQCECRMKRDI